VRAIPQAHSSIVSTLAEQGLIGFLPLLACAATLALALRALWLGAEDRVDRALAIYATGAALAYLVMSATLTMIYYGPSNAIMALLVGLVCGRLDVLARPAR
jgi:O-antigen ligase